MCSVFADPRHSAQTLGTTLPRIFLGSSWSGIKRPPLSIIWRKSCRNSSVETEYIPPLAPRNPQFHAAKAWPKEIADCNFGAPTCVKAFAPCRPRTCKIPAVHQSPAPAVSTYLSNLYGSHRSHPFDLAPDRRLLNRRPPRPMVSTTRGTSTLVSKYGRRSCEYFSTCVKVSISLNWD